MYVYISYARKKANQQHLSPLVGYEDVFFRVFLAKGERFDFDREDFLLCDERDFDLDLGSPSSSRSSSSSSRGEGIKLSRIFGKGLTSIVTGSKVEFPKLSFSGTDLGDGFFL
mmetsp:Transcript_3348/g.7955  ORF Transcript_3348/g.7955 Transcript_3348/m.7955 type:complete len:113 (-) Transcript_3348:1359-1697(-)